MIEQIIALNNAEMGMTLLDYFSLIHFVSCSFLFIIIFVILRAIVMSSVSRGSKKSKQEPTKRQTVKGKGSKKKDIKLRTLLLLSLITVMILGVVWELFENSEALPEIDYLFINRREAMINILSDLVFNFLGALTGYAILYNLLKEK